MPDVFKEPEGQPLKTSDMRVEADGKSIIINGQRFNRVVLPSVAELGKTKDQETEELMQELIETDVA